MDGWIDGERKGEGQGGMDGWKEQGMDDGWIDGKRDGQMDRGRDGYMHGMDGWRDG